MLQKYNPKNDNLLIYIDGELIHRDQAKVSVFDSVVQGGDAVWEGIRVYNGKIYCLEEHLTRLQESAKTLHFQNIPTNEHITEAIRETLHANNMTDGVHIRLTLTRGRKITSGMDPRLNQFGCTLIVVAEHKPPVYDKEITLKTSNIRRNSPQFLDSKIHHNNLLNNILAKIEANIAGVDDALMLDAYGFVSETNATNIFMIKNGEVHTPTAESCLPGITRKTVIELCKNHNISIIERNISVAEMYNADEVFVTGTMGELVLVKEIDARKIEDKTNLGVLTILKEYFKKRTQKMGVEI